MQTAIPSIKSHSQKCSNFVQLPCSLKLTINTNNKFKEKVKHTMTLIKNTN